MLNHRHQRLKFAQARGARIQIFCAYHQEWETIGDRGSRGKPGEVPSWAEDNDYRVHPDDAALEYGPVSTALREAVCGLGWGCRAYAGQRLTEEWLLYHEHRQLVVEATAEEVDQFYLFCAEAMADRGQ